MFAAVKSGAAASPLMLSATMPEPAIAVSKLIGTSVAGVRRPRAGDDDHALGAALPRRLRLVAKVRVAREDRARLLIGVFREIAEHDDDLVLDVEALVAVVAEVLGVGDDQAVTGEHHGAAHFDPLSENDSACTLVLPESRGNADCRRPTLPSSSLDR